MLCLNHVDLRGLMIVQMANWLMQEWERGECEVERDNIWARTGVAGGALLNVTECYYFNISGITG